MSAGRLASQAACSCSGVPQNSSVSHHGGSAGSSSGSGGSAPGAAGSAPAAAVGDAGSSDWAGSSSEEYNQLAGTDSSSSHDKSFMCPIANSRLLAASLTISSTTDSLLAVRARDRSGAGDLLIHGHVLDIPGPAFITWEAPRAFRRGYGGVCGREDHDTHAMVECRPQ